MHIAHSIPTWAYIGGFIVINALLSYPLLRSPMIAEADAYARVFLAWQPIARGQFWYIDFTSGWLPFHSLLLRGIYYLTHDPWTSGRVLTFFISSIGIPLFYAYARNYFSRGISLGATLCYTIFPLRLTLGTQTLSEGIFFPIFLLTLLILSRPRLSGSALVVALIANMIAAGIRYDAWFLLPYIWLHALWRFNSWKIKSLTIITSIIVPLWWTINTNIQTRSLFSYATQKFEIAQQGFHPEYFNIYLTLHNVTEIFLEILPMPFLILSGIGLFIALYSKKSYPSKNNLKLILLRALGFLLPLFYFSFIIIQVYTGTMEWVPQRYLFIPASLLLPFIISGALHLVHTRRNLGIALIVLSFCILPSYITNEHKALTADSFPKNYDMLVMPDFWQLATYLQRHPDRQYQYISLPDSEEMFIPVAYFSFHYEIVSHMMEDRDITVNNLMPHIVTEKPLSPLFAKGYTIVLENDHFGVFEKIPE